jgi:site-specific recombinase XerD
MPQRSLELMQRTAEIMTVGDYAAASIQNYLRELRFLFEFYHDRPADEIEANQIIDYLLFLKDHFNAGKDKCRMVAHAYSFFSKKVMNKPYAVPSTLYPRKEFKIPNVMTEEEVALVLTSCKTLKQRALFELFYSTGIRLSECRNLEICCIDSKSMRILIRKGKGNKDRFVLLSQQCLKTLREYYTEHRTEKFLFEGFHKGVRMNDRSIQHAIRELYKAAGLSAKSYNVHTIRHSFATHLLNQGSDLYTLKELLGHSKIETTMIYLHLQDRRRAAVISPLDMLGKTNNLEFIPVKRSAANNIGNLGEQG